MAGVVVSLPEQEAAAMVRTWNFLLHLSSGELRVSGRVTDLRAEARELAKHFPLGGDLAAAARRYAPELLGKVEREADQLAQEAAREADRANAAEARVEELEPTIPPDYLNMP